MSPPCGDKWAVGADSISARRVWQGRGILAGEHCPPLHGFKGSPQGEPPSTPIEFLLAPEGSNGEEAKSVKKRAALLHVLAFCFLDHIFGVPRGRALGGAQRAPPVCCANSLVRLFAPLGRTLLAPRFRCAQPWPLARNPAIPWAGPPALSEVAGPFSVPFGVPKGTHSG